MPSSALLNFVPYVPGTGLLPLFTCLPTFPLPLLFRVTFLSFILLSPKTPLRQIAPSTYSVSSSGTVCGGRQRQTGLNQYPLPDVLHLLPSL